VKTNVVELEKRVKERTYDLQLSNLELDTFLYHASHDIRRPIATLLGLERVSRLTERDPTSKYLFDCVAKTAGDMDSMLSKLQMAYHINRPIDDFQWISLHWIINETAKKFNEEFHQGGIDFSHQQNGQIFGSFSPSLVMIIFSNLIENAIHFNEGRPNNRSFIRITSSQVDESVIITVEDNGMGIQNQYLGKIFELYFRGTERSKGNGIGLYLVRKAVSILNGEIEVSSQFEVGTTFRISFALNKNP
jgi:signal transduction histidine kinase